MNSIVLGLWCFLKGYTCECVANRKAINTLSEQLEIHLNHARNQGCALPRSAFLKQFGARRDLKRNKNPTNGPKMV